MQIGNSAPFSYSMLDISTNSPLEIAEVKEMRNLGVLCTNDLKSSLQCRKAAAKAMQILCLLSRSIQLFFSWFIELLNCSPSGILYSGHEPILGKRCLSNGKGAETIRLLPSLRDLPYETWLERLGLYSLSYRRQRGDLIEMQAVKWL